MEFVSLISAHIRVEESAKVEGRIKTGDIAKPRKEHKKVVTPPAPIGAGR